MPVFPQKSLAAFQHEYRRAGVHIVEVRHAQADGEERPDEPAFFVRVDRVVTPGEGTPDRAQREQRVERNLGQRRPDLHVIQERRPQAAKDTKPRHRHALAEGIGHEIDLVAERGEGADAVKPR